MNHFKKQVEKQDGKSHGMDGGLKWRDEQCYNFNVTDNMKRKFSSETIYKVNAADDFVLDDETFDWNLLDLI